MEWYYWAAIVVLVLLVVYYIYVLFYKQSATGKPIPPEYVVVTSSTEKGLHCPEGYDWATRGVDFYKYNDVTKLYSAKCRKL